MEKLIISQIINPWFLKSQTTHVRESSQHLEKFQDDLALENI